MNTYGRGDGTVSDLGIEQCHGYGWECISYDLNILGLYVGANSRAGLYMSPYGSSGCNVQNIKASYNGSAWSTSQVDGANIALCGSGINLLGFRCQESYGSNLVIAGGQTCMITQGTCEDTADQWPEGGNGGSTPPYPYRAGVAFVGTSSRPASNNRLLDVDVDCIIHSTSNFATHGIFFDGSCTANQGRFTSARTDWGQGAGADAMPANATSGPYVPAIWGSNNTNNTPDASNKVTVNGAQDW